MGEDSERLIIERLRKFPRTQLEDYLEKFEVSEWLSNQVLELIIKDYIKHNQIPNCVDFLQSYLHCNLNEAYKKIEEYQETPKY